MDAGQVASSIPFTAWEQGVFVVLFILLVVIILGWQTRQQKSWQDFIKEQDERWQKWLGDYNNKNADAMEKVTAALENLSKKLEEHDNHVEDRINQINRKTQPRGR